MYTILIVEDSPFHIDLLVASLENEYNLLIAIDAEKALSILKNEIPDLIILDAILPGMNGFQFLELLHETTQL
jgi:CheY-like chemotaxis protein